MKDYLKSWIPKIKHYSLELDKLSKMYNQPWVVINELNDYIKIIFQDKGRLIVSKNGIVSDGSWEMVSVANSILLNINEEKRLYNHQFIDNALMILKLDGFSNDYFVLANQNIIPNLDIEGYLNTTYSNSESDNTNRQINSNYEKEIELNNGNTLQIIKDLGYSNSSEVRINHKKPENGYYRALNSELVYHIENGKMKMEYYIERYKQPDGKVIEVCGSRRAGIGKNSPVFLNGSLAPDGEYKKGWYSTIIVENGLIK